jgi:uncharacterized membrane protein YphA (DoxX/SURF4 family)
MKGAAASAGIAARTIAAARIAVGVMFLFFGEYKIAGPEFAQVNFLVWVRGFLDQEQAVGFYRAFLEKYVVTHPWFWARLIGWTEFAIGVCLVLGLQVRLASVAGAVHMLNLSLATWYAPGHGAPLWRYLGANLDHNSLLLLFAVFFASNSSAVWSLGGVLALQKGRS